MKIYARTQDRNSISNQISKFLGQDIWVKIEMNGRLYGAKFRSIDPNPKEAEAKVNWCCISWSDLSHLGNIGAGRWLKDKITTEYWHRRTPISWIDKLYPEMYTTNELLDMITEAESRRNNDLSLRE